MISNHYNNQSVSDRVTKTVAVVAITLLLSTATCLAQTYEGVCAELEIDDTFCEGHTANFPKGVCSYGPPSVTSSTFCNPSFYGFWKDYCPNQNVNVSQFCEGTWYYGPFPPLDRPCLALTPCKTNADCTVIFVPAPSNAPVPAFKPYCYDCCLFCHDDAKCQELPMYANSTNITDCWPCFTTPEPIASDIQPSDTAQEPFASNVPRQQSANDNAPDGFKMSPWMYIAIAIAIVAPLVLLFVLLFRHKCAKDTPLSNYDKLNEDTSVNMIEIEE